MNTMDPLDFVEVKLALAKYPNRDPIERSTEVLQAELVAKLVRALHVDCPLAQQGA